MTLEPFRVQDTHLPASYKVVGWLASTEPFPSITLSRFFFSFLLSTASQDVKGKKKRNDDNFDLFYLLSLRTKQQPIQINVCSTTG